MNELRLGIFIVLNIIGLNYGMMNGSETLNNNSMECNDKMTCTECIGMGWDCLWCESSLGCLDAPSSSEDLYNLVFNFTLEQCPDWRWKQCGIKGAFAVFAVATFIWVLLCFCCCCFICYFCIGRKKKQGFIELGDLNEFEKVHGQDSFLHNFNDVHEGKFSHRTKRDLPRLDTPLSEARRFFHSPSSRSLPSKFASFHSSSESEDSSFPEKTTSSQQKSMSLETRNPPPQRTKSTFADDTKDEEFSAPSTNPFDSTPMKDSGPSPLLEEIDPPKPTIATVVVKEGLGKLLSRDEGEWNQRYFIMDPTQLLYYKRVGNHYCAEPKIIRLGNILVAVEVFAKISQSDERAIKLVPMIEGRRVYMLYFADHSDWVVQLNRAIQPLHSAKPRLPPTSNDTQSSNEQPTKEEVPSKEPIIEQCGWMEKRGHIRKNWKPRWFVVEDGDVVYYVNETKKKLKGRIHCTGSTCVVDERFSVDLGVPVLRVLTRPNNRKLTKEFLLVCRDDFARQQWVDTFALLSGRT